MRPQAHEEVYARSIQALPPDRQLRVKIGKLEVVPYFYEFATDSCLLDSAS